MAGDLALENIEEFLFDEDRVVSYKWLSKALSMHVNQAKSKLEEFAENWREKPGSKPITLTFFVSGIQETTSGNELTKVAIVREEDLENVKKNLKKTLCAHIYSIQKSALKDTAVLYQTDFDETKQNLSECNKFSAIKCKSVQTRSVDSLVPVVSSVSNGRASPVEEKKEKVGASKPAAAPAEKKKGLAAFMKQHQTQEKSETKQTKVSPVNDKKSSSTAKKGSLLHAFQSSKKTSPKSQTVAKEPTEAPKVENESKKEESLQEDEEEKVPSPTKEDEVKSKESPLQKEVKTDKLEKKKEIVSEKKKEIVPKKSSKRDMSDSDSESESKAKRSKGTKRRRVIQEESSSEEEESDHEMLEEEEEEVEMDETPIPPTPELKSKTRQEKESESPSTQEENTDERKRGRKKVWKKKRYVDEDGCMVTEKVFDYESGEGSGDEKETEGSAEKTSPSTKDDQSPEDKSSTSSSTDKNSKKESPPSSGRKQTALTSFFKKR